MEARCHRLAIVAHSQGGAVAVEALRTRVFEGYDKDRFLLVTLGSGLSKLEELRCSQAHKKWGVVLGWGPIIGLVIILSWLFRGNTQQIIRDLAPPGPLPGVIVGAAFWFFSSMATIRLKRFAPEDFDPGTQFGIQLTWLDYYASADPVPNGPLFDQEEQPSYLASCDVHNFDSLLHDHTTYWRNLDGFVTQVVVPLAKLGQFPLMMDADDETRLKPVPFRRRWRVAWLRVVPTDRLIGVGFRPARTFIP
jgi:hypothetical protein